MPAPTSDERELLLRFLQAQRDAVVRKSEGLSDDQGRWQPDGKLISLAGIINHLAHVEWRWIDGRLLGADVSRSEEEFSPEAPLAEVVAAYRQRWEKSDAAVRDAPGVDAVYSHPVRGDLALRWILLHLIEETARHAGHADATRELLDGTVGT